ncbi:hypothetical protein RF11_07683 [Thelohanellus kitauei]|uniref:Uncharacterized protein n=1 Tax=Thelohanellus kitauei TaxID=669202 RepID=A0A0C2NFF4_THEKT|nr:hypothetical protein RF11_07683 [Thelohanellus kitauei]
MDIHGRDSVSYMISVVLSTRMDQNRPVKMATTASSTIIYTRACQYLWLGRARPAKEMILSHHHHITRVQHGHRSHSLTARLTANDTSKLYADLHPACNKSEIWEFLKWISLKNMYFHSSRTVVKRLTVPNGERMAILDYIQDVHIKLYKPMNCQPFSRGKCGKENRLPNNTQTIAERTVTRLLYGNTHKVALAVKASICGRYLVRLMPHRRTDGDRSTSSEGKRPYKSIEDRKSLQCSGPRHDFCTTQG